MIGLKQYLEALAEEDAPADVPGEVTQRKPVGPRRALPHRRHTTEVKELSPFVQSHWKEARQAAPACPGFRNPGSRKPPPTASTGPCPDSATPSTTPAHSPLPPHSPSAGAHYAAGSPRPRDSRMSGGIPVICRPALNDDPALSPSTVTATARLAGVCPSPTCCPITPRVSREDCPPRWSIVRRFSQRYRSSSRSRPQLVAIRAALCLSCGGVGERRVAWATRAATAMSRASAMNAQRCMARG